MQFLKTWGHEIAIVLLGLWAAIGTVGQSGVLNYLTNFLYAHGWAAPTVAGLSIIVARLRMPPSDSGTPKTGSGIAIILLCLISVFSLSGCSTTAAAKAQAIIGAVLQVAQTEQSLIPQQDQTKYANFVNLGISLNAQLGNCINAITKKLTTCFNTFAQGLLSPTEMNELRLLSPNTQSRVQLYVTAIVAGVNVIVAFTTPSVSATPTPTADLFNLGHEVGLNDSQIAMEIR